MGNNKMKTYLNIFLIFVLFSMPFEISPKKLEIKKNSSISTRHSSQSCKIGLFDDDFSWRVDNKKVYFSIHSSQRSCNFSYKLNRDLTDDIWKIQNMSRSCNCKVRFYSNNSQTKEFNLLPHETQTDGVKGTSVNRVEIECVRS